MTKIAKHRRGGLITHGVGVNGPDGGSGWNGGEEGPNPKHYSVGRLPYRGREQPDRWWT